MHLPLGANGPGIHPAKSSKATGSVCCPENISPGVLGARGASQERARGGVRAPCAAAICQGVLKCFNTCTPGLATPGCAGYKSALPLSAFGRGRCLGGAGLGGASYEQENQRGFWQFAWPPLYLSVNSRFTGHLPPAESLRARSAMPLQVATAGFKGPDAGSRAGGRWFLQQRGVVHLSLFSLAKL